MAESAEERVSRFYNTVGWETSLGITEESQRFEDLREFAKEYVSKCRLRILEHIPKQGSNILDMASGPIQYDEYLEYSKNFAKRYCIDLSSIALAMAKQKIGAHGIFLHGSFFDINLSANFFDCAISLHTLYHIDEIKQEEAVKKLLFAVKPGKPVIIVYSNPDTFIRRPIRFVRSLFRIKLVNRNKCILNIFRKIERERDLGLYFYAHPLEWWERFSDIASVKILPWRSFSSEHQKMLIPNNSFGKRLFKILFNLEERYPVFFVRHFQYPMIILTKSEGSRDDLL